MKDELVRAARMFLRNRQPIAAALLFAELVRAKNRDPEVWAGLAAALLGARGGPVLTRRSLEIWAAFVVRDAAPIVAGTPLDETVRTLAKQLTAPADDSQFEAAEHDALQRYLLGAGPVLPAGIDGLPAADHLHAVTLVTELSVPAVPVVIAAIGGRWGSGPARAVLRRVDRFTHVEAVRAALTAATRSRDREALEPYLGRALDALAPTDELGRRK